MVARQMLRSWRFSLFFLVFALGACTGRVWFFSEDNYYPKSAPLCVSLLLR